MNAVSRTDREILEGVARGESVLENRFGKAIARILLEVLESHPEWGQGK